MATKIKTSLLSNVDIDFDTNRPTSHVSNVYPTFGNEKGKQVEEVSLDGLGVPLLKSSNEKAVDSLKEANIDSNIRGEKLTIEQFANLSNLIYETI